LEEAMKQPPVCRKCGVTHFNFTDCAMAETFNAERGENARRLQNLAQPVLRPRANDWNNRYGQGDYQQTAPGVVVLKRPPLHSLSRPDRPADSKQLLGEAAADLLGGKDAA
jgi:hypothetical protein